MNKDKKPKLITLKDLAHKTEISVPTIYHYINNGLLPPPTRIKNEKTRRGVLAVYPESIVARVLLIKNHLKTYHSLDMFKEKHLFPEKKKKESIIQRLKRALHLAEDGKYNRREFEDEIASIRSLIKASTITATMCDGVSLKVSRKKNKKGE